jgi:hypothetical protein
LKLTPSDFTIWSVFTSALFEDNLLKSIFILAPTFSFLSALEVVWSRRAVLMLILFSILTASVSTFVLQLMAVSGSFHGQSGVLMAASIGYRHAFPTRPLAPFLSELIPTRIFQSRHLPFVLLCSSFIGSLCAPRYFTDFQFAAFSFFWAWFYLRYLFFFEFANVRGDHSSDFSFDFLFPRALRPALIRYFTQPLYTFFE